MENLHIEQQLWDSVISQISWKSMPESGDIWSQPYDSSWASQEWGKVIDGYVTLFHGTSEYNIESILKDGLKLNQWIPKEELEWDESEEEQLGLWLTTTPYYAFFYGDICVRLRIPVEWIEEVSGDEIWLSREVPASMIIEVKDIVTWRQNK